MASPAVGLVVSRAKSEHVAETGSFYCSLRPDTTLGLILWVRTKLQRNNQTPLGGVSQKLPSGTELCQGTGHGALLWHAAPAP